MKNQAQWNQMTVEQRAVILRHFAGGKRVGSRLKHKILYGRWESLGESTQDKLYRIDWIAALLYPVTPIPCECNELGKCALHDPRPLNSVTE